MGNDEPFQEYKCLNSTETLNGYITECHCLFPSILVAKVPCSAHRDTSVFSFLRKQHFADACEELSDTGKRFYRCTEEGHTVAKCRNVILRALHKAYSWWFSLPGSCSRTTPREEQAMKNLKFLQINPNLAAIAPQLLHEAMGERQDDLLIERTLPDQRRLQIPIV